MTRLLRAAAPLALAVPLLVAACAEAPPPAATPQAAAAPPPVAFNGAAKDVSPADQEMLAIARAEEEIDRVFPEANRATGPHKAAKGAPAQPAKPADQPAPAEQRAAGTAAAGDACTIACKALASMMTSAEHLCRLAGENDGRCDDARARVSGARARVKTACPTCSAAPAAPAATPKSAPPSVPTGPAPGMPGSSNMPIP